ncbi:hypothetical protein A2368_02265 [Candidatus Collierbacteria bacterium RIFOXYB1_FULL_49_13]|uniref:Uncharacterized protein n=1 Tax=Candidatus Collierbacteria bacterium RIFOXYB1_FULL_49_13 TaxID=1817728 RepID=A0A1F5FIZ2_9BACT|nr:MAG: hypothetical protein A2368_02265 [Candidatus Collierbacteria bacterium RIFOXYB1_FULL_49_13]
MSYVILVVPTPHCIGTPEMTHVGPGVDYHRALLVECLIFLRDNGFDQAVTRHEQQLPKAMAHVDFYQLDSRDSDAGYLLLDYLLDKGWRLVSTAGTSRGHGNSEVDRLIFTLEK